MIWVQSAEDGACPTWNFVGETTKPRVTSMRATTSSAGFAMSPFTRQMWRPDWRPRGSVLSRLKCRSWFCGANSGKLTTSTWARFLTHRVCHPGLRIMLMSPLPHRDFTRHGRALYLSLSMNPNRATWSRRHFLGVTGLTSVSGLLGFPALVRARAPNEKLNIAVIGCGGRGAGNLAEVSGENIVALCDVNERNLDAATARHPQARKHTDFRRLYDDAKDIDAVVVSCAEHTHAFATLPAL